MPCPIIPDDLLSMEGSRAGGPRSAFCIITTHVVKDSGDSVPPCDTVGGAGMGTACRAPTSATFFLVPMRCVGTIKSKDHCRDKACLVSTSSLNIEVRFFAGNHFTHATPQRNSSSYIPDVGRKRLVPHAGLTGEFVPVGLPPVGGELAGEGVG